MTIPAKFEHGVFQPLGDVEMAEGTLVEVHVPAVRLAKPASIRDLGFVGMWADRDDIPDGISYVNVLRDNRR